MGNQQIGEATHSGQNFSYPTFQILGGFHLRITGRAGNVTNYFRKGVL